MENNTTKYLKYALGEIILVVIGILIALQINNWNEERKDRKTEVKLLLELKEDLIETKNDLLTDIEKSQQIIDTTNSIYRTIIENGISDKVPLKISTTYILEVSLLYPKLSAYETIQSTGINIISNDKLRKRITDFFQLQLKRVASAEEYLEGIDSNLLKPYLHSHSRYGNNCRNCPDLYSLFDSNNSMETNLYIMSNIDDELVHILKERFTVFRTLNRRYLDLSSSIDDIIILINQEISLKE
ncbi:MAG: DUF6090 family protein [Flavobacteriaceae bacterium]